LDLAKYRAIFIEEATEHFAEMSGALLALEKNPASVESIDVVFRMAHSIKGMAASLGYDTVTEVSHLMEDRMQVIRSEGRVRPGPELSLLFRTLSALEEMVEVVKTSDDLPGPPPAELVEALSTPATDEEDEPGPAVPAEPVVEAPAPASAEISAAPEPKAAASEPSQRTVDTPRPPPSVRVQTDTLDRFLSTVGEVILNTSQVRTAAAVYEATKAPDLAEGLDRMDRVVGELQRRALELRTTRLLRILEPLPRMARELAERSGKRVEVELLGAELELDRSILDRLSDPLVHLLRNAVDHGVETPEARVASGKRDVGHIVVEARREKDSIRISVTDDGAGVDLERVKARAVEAGVLHQDLADDLSPEQIAAFIFHPGLSTSERVSEISGRGVGMDAVKASIESLGGMVEVASDAGRGTAMSILVPITAAVQRVLLMGLGEEIVALPISKVERVLEVPGERIERSGNDAFVMVDDELVLVFDLADRLALAPTSRDRPVHLVLTEVRGERVALAAERIDGQQQIYVKPVPELLADKRALAGLTILGDGRPVFLVDLNQVT
jgi:two-component system chemotaxis sensor kinase CheA